METTAIQRVRTGAGDEAWRVTGYELVRRLLADDRLGRSHPDPENAARTSGSALLEPSLFEPADRYETAHDDHARNRALLMTHFTAKRVRALQPRVEELTAQLLDGLARRPRPADLVAAVAAPLPVQVICELLGVPYADREQFQAWTNAAGDGTDQVRSAKGLGELFEYGQELVGRKRREPGDDVISRLSGESSLADAEIAGFAMMLLFAGHETVVAQIGFGASLLLADPSQWDALVADPGLLDNAIEEILRVPGRSGGGIPRYAREDLTIGDVRVPAGDLVLLDIVAANHDPSVFKDPGQFDVARLAASHLTFGYGSNYCIGAPLARVELKVVFSQLVARFPTLRLAVGEAELRHHDDRLTGGLVELPVTW